MGKVKQNKGSQDNGMTDTMHNLHSTIQFKGGDLRFIKKAILIRVSLCINKNNVIIRDCSFDNRIFCKVK